jgi:hypothetical protein
MSLYGLEVPTGYGETHDAARKGPEGLSTEGRRVGSLPSLEPATLSGKTRIGHTGLRAVACG